MDKENIFTKDIFLKTIPIIGNIWKSCDLAKHQNDSLAFGKWKLDSQAVNLIDSMKNRGEKEESLYSP